MKDSNGTQWTIVRPAIGREDGINAGADIRSEGPADDAGGESIGGYEGRSGMTDYEPLVVVSEPNYVERAEDIRRRLQAALEPACAVVDEAVAAGFTVSFKVGMNMFGKQVVQAIELARPY